MMCLKVPSPVKLVQQPRASRTVAGEVVFWFFNFEQAHNRDKETLTQTTPLIDWLQLT